LWLHATLVAEHVLCAAGAEHVMCCKKAINDRAAIIFAEQYYKAHSNGRTIKFFYDFATQCVIQQLREPIVDAENEARKIVFLPKKGRQDVMVLPRSPSPSFWPIPSKHFVIQIKFI
jgi:hypothetical protein